jgi:hypothetical protein
MGIGWLLSQGKGQRQRHARPPVTNRSGLVTAQLFGLQRDGAIVNRTLPSGNGFD